MAGRGGLLTMLAAWCFGGPLAHAGGERRLCQGPGSGERFLYYFKDTGWCAGSGHTSYSHVCMAAEARYLNRTLIYDDRFCNHKTHWLPKGEYWDVNSDPSRRDVYEDALANHIDITKWESLPAISKDAWFSSEPCIRARLGAQASKQGVAEARARFNLPPRVLKNSEKYKSSLVLIRDQWPRAHANKFWFHVCKWHASDFMPAGNKARGAARGIAGEQFVKRHYAYWQPGTQLVRRTAKGVIARLGTNFTAVHVRRGDRVRPAQCYPNVTEVDLQPAHIAQVLRERAVPAGSVVYVLSDEPTPHFFERPPLSTEYTLHTRDTLRTVLEPAMHTNYQLFSVERAVMARARVRLETFNDLTDVPMLGICRHRTARRSRRTR